MGPSSFYTDQNECSCGLWVRDLGSFLKKILIILEVDAAQLIATVKHHGVQIGDTWNRRNGNYYYMLIRNIYDKATC